MLSPIGNLFGHPMFHYEYSVLKFCEKLHLFCFGGVEYGEAFEPWFMKQYLQFKIDNWKTNIKSYDLLVKNLIEQVLSECNKCSWFPTYEDVEKIYTSNQKYCEKILNDLHR